MHPGPAIKLASLLMVHTLSVPAPTVVMSFVMTNNQPSQYTKLMFAPAPNIQWVQFNQPDGSTGYRSGTNYYIYSSKLSNFPIGMFTIKPSP